MKADACIARFACHLRQDIALLKSWLREKVIWMRALLPMTVTASLSSLSGSQITSGLVLCRLVVGRLVR